MKTLTISTPKCQCGLEAEIHIFTKICQMCGYTKDGKLTTTAEETWQEKAEWLRTHGYYLTILALEHVVNEDDNRWVARIFGMDDTDSRRYAPTIESAIEQVYDLITKGIHV